MKSGLTILVLAMAAGAGFGQSRGSVDLYVDGCDASYPLLGRGMPLASDIFKKIGVRLNWHAGELPPGKAGVGIRTVEHAPQSATPEALASSRLTGSAAVEITVYNDRVHRFVESHSNLKGVWAAYVLAHELAHAMQGVGRHSESGIMKAHWSDLDFREMVFHKLAFAPVDVDLIHQGLASRLGGPLEGCGFAPENMPDEMRPQPSDNRRHQRENVSMNRQGRTVMVRYGRLTNTGRLVLDRVPERP